MIFSLIKFLILIALFLVLHRFPGDVNINWHVYEVSMSFATFVLLFIVFVYVLFMVSRFFGSLFFSTERWQKGRKIKGMKSAFAELGEAMMRLSVGQSDRVLKLLKKASKTAPNQAISLGIQAMAYQQSGNAQGLQDTYAEMLKHNETELAGMIGLSRLASAHGDHEGALNQITSAYQKHPKELVLLFEKFELESGLKKWEDALKTLQEYRDCGGVKESEFKKLKSKTLTLQSYEAYEAGDLDLAINVANEAYDADQHTPATVVHYAYLLTKKSEVKQAVKALTKAWDKNPDPVFVKGFKKIVSKKAPKEALKMIEKFVKSHPDHKEAAILLAQTYLRGRMYEDVRKVLKPWLKDAPGLHVARIMLDLEKEVHGSKSKQAEKWRDTILTMSLAD